MTHASACWLTAISCTALLAAIVGCAGGGGNGDTPGSGRGNPSSGAHDGGVTNRGGVTNSSGAANTGGMTNGSGANAGGASAGGTNDDGGTGGEAVGGTYGNAGSDDNPGNNGNAGANSDGPGGVEIWVRILPFGLRDQGWQLDGDTGQDVLDEIAELKPNVLSRFVTGKPDPNWTIPMGPGRAPMKFAEYLTAAMAAGAPGCFLTPRVTLSELWSDAYRVESSQALYDLPVTPRLKVLDLDLYFSSGTDADHQRDLQKLKDIGWTDLVFNFAGGAKETFGLVSYAMTGINGTTGQVNSNNFAKMDDLGIATHLAHIDYPGGIEDFAQLTPDQQATIVQKLSRQQHQDKFTFIYPVLYGTQSYDSSKQVTLANGPFKGATVFQVIKQMILCDRQYPQPCTPQF